MTNHWVDIKNADVVLVMGGNPAEAHPCGFKWVIEAKAHKGAKLIVVDPRFTRTAAVADVFAQLRPGSDIAFLGGVIHHLLEKDAIQKPYVAAYTNAAYLVKEGYGFQDGLFTGYDEAKRTYDKSGWSYELGEDGFAKVDETLQHPRCVYQLMKAHYARYTPKMVADVTGVPEDKFAQICALIASTAPANKTLTSLYALGWTQHSVGSQNIRSIAMIQLLLGNVGMAGGGVNALRGHSNIQGLTDLGLLSELLPGYLGMPRENDPDLKTYLEKKTQKPIRPGQMSYWQNYPKFFVSLMKAWYGKAATRENDWAFEYLPKLDKTYDVLAVFDLMHQGKVNGYVCQGFNPIASISNKEKVVAALSRLKFLVTIDPLVTETSNFWQNHGELNPVDPAAIQTEVFRLPSSCFAEEDGSLVNSGRVLQWHWRAADPPGEAKQDAEIVAELFTRIRALYQKEGGAYPEPILNLAWDYKIPRAPSAEELAREFNGKALADVPDPKMADPKRDPKAPPLPPLAKEGEQLATFAHLGDDGGTACGNWLYCGSFTQAGNQMARRDPADPSGLGLTLGWGWAWPANRRILYNRASADPAGKPWDPDRKLAWWNGAKWVGNDVPDMRLDAKPEDGVSPFIMNPEGVARLFALDKMAEGPFPEHYEPFESPVAANPLHPKVGPNPAARIYKADRDQLGLPGEFPYAATTYRVVEHFHTWTKHARIPAILQPELFIELDETLAAAKGIRSGDRVQVRSKRGKIVGKAVVTKRLKPLTIAGKQVHTVGIPIHWGFDGLTRPGHIANTLTPFVGDANTQTPEFKAFLVDVAKAPAGQA
jgi:formate dehydrogenase major subunit